MAADKTTAYRDDLRANLARHRPNYSGIRHLVVMMGVLVGAMVVSATRVGAVRPLEWLVVPLGFVMANLVEYLAHRYLLHRPKPVPFLYRRHSARHHRFFTHEQPYVGRGHLDFPIVLFPVPVTAFFLVGVAMPLAVGLGLAFGSNVGWIFLATAQAYYTFYELWHLAVHLPPRGWMRSVPLLTRCRELHRLHHDPRRMRHEYFNITIPLWDAILRTPSGRPTAPSSER